MASRSARMASRWAKMVFCSIKATAWSARMAPSPATASPGGLKVVIPRNCMLQQGALWVGTRAPTRERGDAQKVSPGGAKTNESFGKSQNNVKKSILRFHGILRSAKRLLLLAQMASRSARMASRWAKMTFCSMKATSWSARMAPSLATASPEEPKVVIPCNRMLREGALWVCTRAPTREQWGEPGCRLEQYPGQPEWRPVQPQLPQGGPKW